VPELSGELFTPEEVAGLLGAPLAQVESWLDLRSLPSIALPEGRRIRRVDLEPFAVPLVEPEALDALVREDPSEPTQLLAMKATAAGLSHLFAAHRFDQESRARPLFHYTSAETALDYILVGRQLRLSPPSGMNDPFESDPHWVTLSGDWDGAPDELLKLASSASDELRRSCRLACLTRSGPNSWASLIGYGNGYMRARMWAQYADGHAGVCLAFDQAKLVEAAKRNERPGVRLYKGPMQYRSEEDREILIQLPLAQVATDLHGLVDGLFPSVVAGLYFSKAWDWSTESEYRFLLRGAVAEFEYIDIGSSLTGVFCGPRFPDARLADLRARCPELWEAGRVFRIAWRNGHPIPMRLQGDAPAPAGWQLPDPPDDPA
jgi:hypothetical protein